MVFGPWYLMSVRGTSLYMCVAIFAHFSRRDRRSSESFSPTELTPILTTYLSREEKEGKKGREKEKGGMDGKRGGH